MNEIQETLLMMMVDLDAAMRKCNLDYILHAGSLLGAVRHKGFIPWDDDIDICILEKDVYLLKDVMKELPEGKYELQEPFSTDWARLHYKLRLNNSTAIEENFRNSRIHQGMFLDIFVLRPYPSKGIRRSIYTALQKVEKTVALLSDKTMGKPILNPIQWILKLFLKIGIKTMDIVAGKNADKFYDGYLWAVDPFDRRYFENRTDLEMEGHMFSATSLWDEMLTELFGDYMTLPKEEDRVTQHLVAFDRNKDYREWLKEN